MNTYNLTHYTSTTFNTTNGREACQWLFDQGCFPDMKKRPELKDKFNPVMMMKSAVDCDILVNGIDLFHKSSVQVADLTPLSSSVVVESYITPPTITIAHTMSPEESIAAAIQQMVQSSTPALNETRVIELINQAVSQIDIPVPVATQIRIADLPVVEIGRQHKDFNLLVTLLANKTHTMLHGESGSGKSTAASKAAEALNVPFHFLSVGATTTKFEFFGYTDANGNVVHTEFRKAFTNGGVFLVDEFDSGSANVGIALNEALANGRAAFPDGIFEAHPDFICVAAANTSGNGATSEYRGRNAMDKATLDRFFFLEWNIDSDFEFELCPDKRWVAKVQKIRIIMKDLGIKHPVTPRASFDGAKMLAAGMSEVKVLHGCIFKGSISNDSIEQILDRL